MRKMNKLTKLRAAVNCRAYPQAMNVVVNATPLITLALVGQLSLLREMFDAVIVPRAVYEEVVIDGYGQPGAAELAQAS